MPAFVRSCFSGKILSALFVAVALPGGLTWAQSIPTTTNDFFQPGTQPNTMVQPLFASSDTCSACHGKGTIGGEIVCPECKGSGNIVKTMGNMRFNVACPRCQGRKKIANPCSVCGGEGRVSEPESLDVRIPAGVQDGFRVRVAARGNAGAHGGPRGDLYIVTKVAPHSFFDRQGDDIYTKIPVTIAEAALGAKVEVPTIDGTRALLKIPPGTASGQKFRLREKGVASLKTGQRGDQYVEVRVHVPKVADERSREILRELSHLNPENPRAELYRQL